MLQFGDFIEFLNCNILRQVLKKKKKKKTPVILSALCPLTLYSTWDQHILQMFADHCGPRQTIP